MTDDTLDQILDALDRKQQRATYGAVAAVLGKAPRTLMKGRERDQRRAFETGTQRLFEAPRDHQVVRDKHDLSLIHISEPTRPY